MTNRPLFPSPRWVLTLTLALLGLTCAAQFAKAGERYTVERAVRDGMTRRIWKGKRLYLHHCRDALEGCEDRIQIFAGYFREAGKAHGVDPLLLVAIAYHESRFVPAAHGGVGEWGIMQIHPKHELAPRFVTDPKYRAACFKQRGACQYEVVQAGAAIVARRLAKCGGSVRCAVRDYNSGKGHGELSGYQRAVVRLYERLRGGRAS